MYSRGLDRGKTLTLIAYKKSLAKISISLEIRSLLGLSSRVKERPKAWVKHCLGLRAPNPGPLQKSLKSRQ